MIIIIIITINIISIDTIRENFMQHISLYFSHEPPLRPHFPEVWLLLIALQVPESNFGNMCKLEVRNITLLELRLSRRRLWRFVTPCSSERVQRFGGITALHLQGQSQARNRQKGAKLGACFCWFLAWPASKMETMHSSVTSGSRN
jgi:hypothetical protein